MRPLVLAAALLAALRPRPCVCAQQDARPAFGKPAAAIDRGALVLLPLGTESAMVMAEMRKSLGRSYAVDSATDGDTKALQLAIDRLQGRRVKMIVVAPLLLSSYSANMDQTRYVLGIREFPSERYLGTPHRHAGYALARRVKSKVPIVLTQALDDHGILADILASRALAQSKDAARESLVLVAESEGGDQADSQWSGTIRSLGEKVRKATGFKSVSTVILPDDADRPGRDKAAAALRATVRSLGSEGRVIVVPVTLVRGPERGLRKVFDGLFVRFDGKPALPDARVAGWIEESVEKGSKLPDMRAFSKESMPPAAPLATKRQTLAPPKEPAPARNP